MREADFALYLISNRRLVPSIPEVFGAIARALPPGGVAFQVREKDLSARALFTLVSEVLAEVRPWGQKVFVNDRLDVALCAGADGVHLSTRSVPVRQASALVPLLEGSSREREAWVLSPASPPCSCVANAARGGDPAAPPMPPLGLGASAHSLAEIEDAAGASFFTFGPVFETPSKARYGPPVGVQALQEAARFCAAPVYALGGITRERVAEVIRYGAAGVALISAILAAKDPVGESRAIWEEVLRARA